MRTLSQTATILLEALRRPRGALELLSGSRGAVAAADEIVAQPEAGLVPYLLFAFEEGGLGGRSAARALTACVAVATPDELLQLDERCRRAWWSGHFQEHAVGPRDVARLVAQADDRARIAGVLSFHPDGRVRENAVKELAALSDGRELPFLLVRLNDWVDAVARRAEKAVQKRMTSAYAPVLVDYLPIVMRLETRRRRRHDAVIAGVVALITAPENRAALVRGFASLDRRVRRTLYRAAFAARELDRVALIERALGDEDTVIRVSAAQLARRELSAEALLRITPRLKNDPYPPVRLEWLAATMERNLPESNALLYEALVDRSRTARETARFVLRQHRAFGDFRSFYRERIEQLSNGAAGAYVLAAAIAGLGETGRAEDVDVPLRLMRDARPAVRIACVRAMAMLDLEGSLPRLVEMLCDPSPGVTRTVRTVVSPRAGGLSADLLRRVLSETPYVHGRLNAVLLAGCLGKWDAIVLLLESLSDPSPAVRETALDRVRHWLSRSNAAFNPPTSAQLDRLGALLAARPLALGPTLPREIEAIARYSK
jgi:HEAT repeat protein